MRQKHTILAAIAAFTMLLGACAPPPEAGVTSPNDFTAVAGYNSSAVWTTASYDAHGFPIFGYTYGRAVYGYTPAGAPLFTFNALASGCYVPQWKPAPWYCGEQEYSTRHERVTAPPNFPKGHRPAERPSGGQMAAIHRDPGAVFGGRPPRPNPLPNVPLPTRDSNAGGSSVAYYSTTDDYWHDYWYDTSHRQHHHRQHHRPPHHGAHHRPGMGGGSHHRPSFGGGGSHHRPSFGGGGSHHRPSFGGGGSHHRPSFGGGGSHHRPSFSDASRPAPSHNSGSSHHSSRSDDSRRDFPPFFPGGRRR